MKKLIVLFLSCVLLASCGQNNTNSNSNKKTEKKNVQELTEMLANTDSLLNKEVCFKGWVSHTCKHSGRRCFIKSEDGSVSIRVEASGKIKGFNKELTGEQMKINGILRMKELTDQFLDEWQAKVEAKQKEDDIEEGGEHCSAELTNIKEMRDWMKEHKKDYYPIYYVDGKDYEVIHE